jgi:hypothetical protein
VNDAKLEEIEQKKYLDKKLRKERKILTGNAQCVCVCVCV